MNKVLLQPLFFYPMNIMLIDDSEPLLNSIMDRLGKGFPFIAYKNPIKALEYLNSHVFPLDQVSRKIIKDVDPKVVETLTDENVGFDFSILHADIDKSDPYSMVSVAVIDKVMNEMDGLKLCAEIKSLGLPVKCILLTGNTGLEEAIKAFNNHDIDAFIQKSDNNAIENLKLKISELTHEFFCYISAQLMGPLLSKLPLLYDKKFTEFFKRICKENNVIAYYMLDTSCSFLMLTASGEAKVLLLKAPDEFEVAYEIASDDGLEADLLDSLKMHAAFPFAEAKRSYISFKPEEWRSAMVSMNKVEGIAQYYGIADIVMPVFSLDRYMSDVWERKII